jgi:hypothetical protein
MKPMIDATMMPASASLLGPWVVLAATSWIKSFIVALRQARKAVFKPAGKDVSASNGEAVSLPLGWFEKHDDVLL